MTAKDLTLQRTNAGHVDFIKGDHPLKKGLFGTPSQTYFEVPLGFPATNQAPHYGVTRATWEAKGGTTGTTALVSLGRPIHFPPARKRATA